VSVSIIQRVSLSQWAKSPEKQSKGVRFYLFDTQNTVPYCQKNTPTDCFFGDISVFSIALDMGDRMLEGERHIYFQFPVTYRTGLIML